MLQTWHDHTAPRLDALRLEQEGSSISQHSLVPQGVQMTMMASRIPASGLWQRDLQPRVRTGRAPRCSTPAKPLAGQDLNAANGLS